MFNAVELSKDSQNRLNYLLKSISEQQQALVRIRPLTLRNFVIGQKSDDIDQEISTALLGFENQFPGGFFKLRFTELHRDPELIVIIASSPRTGNSITRIMVGRMGFIMYAVHSLDDLNFTSLGNRSVIQCHSNAPTIEKLKAQFNVKVITLVRDPLDVTESMRKYVAKNIEAKYWGIAIPVHEIEKLVEAKRFYRWAIGRDARRLINLSLDVVKNTETKVIRYEELVSNPKETFDTIAEYIGGSHLADVEQTLEESTKLLPPSHITRGGPGAGSDVSFAHKILIKFMYRKLFRTLKY